MSEQQRPEIPDLETDPADAPRPEEAEADTLRSDPDEPIDPRAQPAAGGSSDDDPVQGAGEPDSY